MSVRSTRLYGLLKMLESIADELEDLADSSVLSDDLCYISQLVSDAAADLRDIL